MCPKNSIWGFTVQRILSLLIWYKVGERPYKAAFIVGPIWWQGAPIRYEALARALDAVGDRPGRHRHSAPWLATTHRDSL